jgi:hypothetical protein
VCYIKSIPHFLASTVAPPVSATENTVTGERRVGAAAAHHMFDLPWDLADGGATKYFFSGTTTGLLDRMPRRVGLKSTEKGAAQLIFGRRSLALGRWKLPAQPIPTFLSPLSPTTGWFLFRSPLPASRRTHPRGTYGTAAMSLPAATAPSSSGATQPHPQPTEQQGGSRERRVESLGWLTESAVMPKKHKAIEGVGAASILDLKAQLYRTQEEARNPTAPGAAASGGEFRRAKIRSAPTDPLGAKNSGVESRAHKYVSCIDLQSVWCRCCMTI